MEVLISCSLNMFDYTFHLYFNFLFFVPICEEMVWVLDIYVQVIRYPYPYKVQISVADSGLSMQGWELTLSVWGYKGCQGY